jgi:hypothetical protein
VEEPEESTEVLEDKLDEAKGTDLVAV